MRKRGESRSQPHASTICCSTHPTYGQSYRNRLAAMAIIDAPTAPSTPWQNGYVERLIGSVRRERLDLVIAVNDRRLRRVLRSYLTYYNQTRMYLALDKDAPEPRLPANINDGQIVTIPEVGGLHNRYDRLAAWTLCRPILRLGST